MSNRRPVPRDPDNDYTRDQASARRDFTGTDLTHVGSYSFDPEVLPGNIENFIGVAQVPIGLAGPLRVNGEYADGEYYVPLATTEGTLVASYNRGMRLLSEAGGVTTTVVDDRMQRAPVFILDDARQSRDLAAWIRAHHNEIRAAAESTTSIGKLIEVEQYHVGPLLYLRFDYTTGDAAGQNMVGRATWAACEWIAANHPQHPRYVLSGAIDTDKKHSQLNVLRTRGKRVVAEATIPAGLLEERMGVTPMQLFRMRQVSQAGGILAGSANYGAHAANRLAALFIACSRDAASRRVPLPPSPTRNSPRTGTTTGRSPCLRSSWPPSEVGRDFRPSGSAWSCSGAPGPGGRRLSQRSARRWFSPARSRWPAPSSPGTG